MELDEVIKILKIAIAEVEWNYPLDYAIAFETAIKELERLTAENDALRKNLGEVFEGCL